MLIKMAKQVIISRNNQNDKKLLAKKSDSEYDSYVRSIKTLPTSFIESPKTSNSTSIDISYSSDSFGDKILLGFSLFFIALSIISLFSGRYLEAIIAFSIAFFGRTFVIAIFGSWIKF